MAVKKDGREAIKKLVDCIAVPFFGSLNVKIYLE